MTVNFGSSRNLCASEPFRSQPAGRYQVGAHCSAFLIGSNLIATAGHCINADNMTEKRFVFGFRMINATTAQTTIPNEDIYSGKSVVGHELESGNGLDWAIIELDREVVNRRILDIRRAGSVNSSTSLYVIGHPSGLPTKIAGNASVRDNTPTSHFVANLDTYGANSGSPVFNATSHQVEGILVRGETDFVSNGDCNVSKICPNTGCDGESCTRTSAFLSDVPLWCHKSDFGQAAVPMFQNYAPGDFNYEVVVKEGNKAQHYWFSYDGDWQWHKAKSFGLNVQYEPAVFQNYAPGNANYEAFLVENGKVQHYWFSYGGDWQWHKAKSFGNNVTSTPAVFQNHNCNYEVVAQEGDKLRHYWFSYSNGEWHQGEFFGANVTAPPAIFQNRAPGNHNYELVVREGNKLQHYWFDYGGDGKWHKGKYFGDEVVSEPIIFQNHAPNHYNYEILVQEGSKLQHYWFDYGGDWEWHKATSFGSDVQSVATVFQNYEAGNHNYELVVREGNKLQHYWFDYGGDSMWHKGKSFSSNPESPPLLVQNHAPGNVNYELIVRENGNIQHYWFDYSGDWQWHKAKSF